MARDDRPLSNLDSQGLALLNAAAVVAAAQQQQGQYLASSAPGSIVPPGGQGLAVGKVPPLGPYQGPPPRIPTPQFTSSTNGILSKKSSRGNAWGGPGVRQYPPNEVTLPTKKWQRLPADRPLILWSKQMDLTTSVLTGFNGLIYYTPEPAQLGDVANVSAAFLANLQVSVGSGIIYLPGNTEAWWIYNSNAVDLDVLILDGSDPLVAARYLTEQGQQGEKESHGTAAVTGGASVQAWAADRYRKSIIISNKDTATGLRIYPGATSGAAGQAFIRIPANSSPFVLSGQECTRTAAYAFADSAAATVAFTILEYW